MVAEFSVEMCGDVQPDNNRMDSVPHQLQSAKHMTIANNVQCCL